LITVDHCALSRPERNQGTEKMPAVHFAAPVPREGTESKTESLSQKIHAANFP
jgi:hypothetical protein